VGQWQLLSSVSAFVQRAGRAGRDPKRTGLAVLLVEKSVYEANLTRLDEALLDNKKKRVRQSSTYAKALKGYAIRHGVLRGSFDGLSDEIQLKELDTKSLDEGLYTLAQTFLCGQKVLTLIYGNDTPHEFTVKMEIRIIRLFATRSNY
jgi:superfamily II DNA/RNA helicase